METTYTNVSTPDGFPNPLADKNTKNSQAYILAYAKAMYASFGKFGLRMFWNDRVKYGILESYAMGVQPIDKYKKRLDVWGDEPGKRSFINIDWQVLNLATKFVNIIVDKIISTGYDVECKAIDPLALDARREKEARMRAVLEHKAWFDQTGIDLDPQTLGFSPDMLPDHSDDVELHMAMNEKDEFSMNAEMAIALAFTNNSFEQVRREYVRDSVIYGPECVEARNDKNGQPKLKRIPPEMLIMGNSRSEDFKDVVHGGYIENMSFAELQVAAGKQFTQDQYEDIYRNYSSLMGSTATDPRVVYTPAMYQNTNERMVSVMKFYYKTAIQNTYVKKQDRRGNARIYEQGPNTKEKEGQELIKDTYEVVYEGHWVVNSNYMYDYGMMKDLDVDEKNPCATRIPLHVIWPNMLNGKGSSILNFCIPVFDLIQTNWLNFQHMLAQIRPDGEAINIDALADIAFGSGGEKLTAKEILDLYYKRGTLIYSSRGLDGQNGNAKPVEPLQSNNYEKASGYLNNIFSLVGVLRQITGMNEAVDASTPATDALVGTQQMAVEGAFSAIGYLISADKLMVNHLSESIINLTKNAIRRGEVSGYVDSIGVSAVNFWKVNENLTQRQLGIKVVPRPSQAEWSEFYGQLSAALEKGAISTSDFIVMKELTNLKQARQYMAMVERRRAREATKQQQEMQQQQAELNQQSAANAAQMAQQAMQLEVQLKSALIDKEKEKEIAVLHVKYGYENQLMDKQIQQKSDDAELMARTKVVDSTIKTQAQIDKQNHEREERKIKETEKKKTEA